MHTRPQHHAQGHGLPKGQDAHQEATTGSTEARMEALLLSPGLRPLV